jgi:hypothetical protein
VNAGAEAVAFVIPFTIVWLLKVGRVTTVGVFAVKDPAVHEIVSVSSDTVVVSTGIVALAATPAVTDPPPVLDVATYFMSELGVTVIVGAATLPAGV